MAGTESLMEGGQATFEKDSEKVIFELEVEEKNVGLTKEQLEAYRNDPLWKTLRTILFIAFWAAWVVMFAAAIAIVVLSPKCAEKQKPDWWQTKVSYQVLTPTFFDTDADGVGDFNGITEKLDLLRKIGVTTVYPSPVIEIHKDEYFNAYDVIDHTEVDKRFGTEEDFKNLIEAAHNRDMFIVMDIPISSVSLNHSWFVEGGDPSLFVTAQSGDAAYSLPNYHDFPGQNGTKYLGYPTAANPVLNWASKEVQEIISDSIKKFLLLGVDGLHLDHISQLAIDENGNTDHDGAVAALAKLTASIKEFIVSHDDLKDKKIVLTSSLRDVEELHARAKETGDLHYVIDNSFASLQQDKCTEGVAQCAHEALDKAYARHESDLYTPHWQFSNSESSRLASRFDEDTANLLTFMQLTLPGALSLYYGQELGIQNAGASGSRGIMQWAPAGDDHHGFVGAGSVEKLFFAETEGDDTDNFETQYAMENSPLKVYRKLAKLRQRDEALIVGETVRDTLEGDVILFSRYVKHNETINGSAFVVVLNFGDSDASVDLNEKINLPENKNLAKAEIAAVTTGVTELRARDRKDFTVEHLNVPSKQGVLIKL